MACSTVMAISTDWMPCRSSEPAATGQLSEATLARSVVGPRVRGSGRPDRRDQCRECGAEDAGDGEQVEVPLHSRARGQDRAAHDRPGDGAEPPDRECPAD